MNRFRTKKKAPEPVTTNDDAFNALSSQPAPVSPGLKKSGTSRWRRGKKAVEVKPTFDLTNALPSTDDFRTSLLMPTFSARFSMFREPDDPNSLVGKAMDDSVLQPKRRSRMDFGGLDDIAEVSSIKEQVRPPFAFGRQDSFASEDGYTSDGSMLSRARPGEGNVLFGGRQKVYMIPKAGASSQRSLGKQVYEDDIGMSAFQKYRREKEAQAGRSSDESQSSQGFDFGLDHLQAGPGDQYIDHALTPNDSAKDLSHSPSLSSSERKRSTNSTSHSEARSSTAATSIASQPATNTPSPAALPSQPAIPPPAIPSTLKRSDTKTRRLYEQGLDQHMYEQQTSALTRLNSIQRQRIHNGSKQPAPLLHSTKSASNLHEKARQPVYALRGQSPETVPPLLTTVGILRKPTLNGGSPNSSMPQSPTSPIDLDGSNALTEALEPADRGKATAMGAFNKPKQSFDQDEYTERQRQLQRTISNAAIKKEASAPSPFAQRMARPELEQQRKDSSDGDLETSSNAVTRKDSAPTSGFAQRMGRFEQERERDNSFASERSRSRSIPKRPDLKHDPMPEVIPEAVPESTNAYNVFQRAAQMNAQNSVQQFDKSALPDTHRTFFGNISASDSEEEEDDQPQPTHQPFNVPDYGYGAHHGRWQPTVLPSVSEHPALRSQKSKASLVEEDEETEPMPLLPTQSSRSLNLESTKAAKIEPSIDSPTLGPGPSSAPLNGLMHHLRQQSDNSSVFPNDGKPSPNETLELQGWNPKNLDLINRPLRNTAGSDSPYTSSNPFDLEEIGNTLRAGDRASRASISPIEGPRHTSQSESRAASRLAFLNRQSEVSELEQEGEPETSWQSELQKSHTRDPSTATQQERDAFAQELAARRNAIQESIKSKVEQENQSRDASPAPSANGAFRPFGMLRSRPSRESVDNSQRPNAPPKAMKMLGLSGGATNSSSNNLNSQYERGGYSVDMVRSRDESGSRPPTSNNPTRTLQQSEQDVKREWQQSQSRENSESRPVAPPQTGRSPASSAGGRSRANSEVATGRSRSRTGPYRDDLEKAMIEGTGSSAGGFPDMSPMVPRELTPRPSPDITQNHFEPPRVRSNSRTGMTHYFDQKTLQPIQTGLKDRLTPGAHAPAQLSPNVYSPAYSPALGSARPSPTFPFAQNMTPPLSGTSTPVSSTFSPPPEVPPPAGRPRNVLRKKTISKGEISEPTLISSTSTVDTVNLPEGASLRNGMESPPPVPPINPRRRATKGIFGIGPRKVSESGDSPPSYGGRSKTPDPWISRAPAEPEFPFDVARSNRSASGTRSPHKPPHPKQSFEQSPAMRQYAFAPNAGSPDRVQRSPVPPPMPTDGGMF